MVQHFLFSAGNVRCAVPLASIQSVIQMIEMTPASGAHQGLAGAVNLHGRVISVYSMRRLLGSAERQPRLSDMLLIAQAGKETIALWIDETSGVEALDLSLATYPKTGEGPDLIRGISVTGSGILVISDLPAFLEQASGPTLQAVISSLKTDNGLPAPDDKDAAGVAGSLVKSVLAERAAKVLHPEPGTATTEQTEILRFQLAYREYALEMKYVREVILTGEITPVPGTPDFISGICAARGQIISLVDLRALLRIPEKGLTDLNRVIVITDGKITFGLLADTISGVGTIAMDQMTGPDNEDGDAGRGYVKGVLGGGLYVLDAAAILGDPGIIVEDA
jgi:purine-binding chemotaxis protein CheW